MVALLCSTTNDYVSTGEKYKRKVASIVPGVEVGTYYQLGGTEWKDGLPYSLSFGDGRIC